MFRCQMPTHQSSRILCLLIPVVVAATVAVLAFFFLYGTPESQPQVIVANTACPTNVEISPTPVSTPPETLVVRESCQPPLVPTIDCELRDFSDAKSIWSLQLYPGFQETCQCYVFSQQNDPIKSAFMRGNWEIGTQCLNLMKGISMELNRKDIAFIDVGANIGTISVPIARYGFRTVMIEVYPTNQQALRQSIVYNSLQNYAMLLPYGVGEKRKTCRVFLPTDSITGNSGVYCTDVENLQHQKNHSRDFMLEIYPFDDLFPKVTQCGFLKDSGEEVMLIKVDIEGYEPLFMMGAEEFFKKSKPIVIMEENVHLKRQGVEFNSKKMADLMRSFGYRPVKVVSPKGDVNRIYAATDRQKMWVDKYFR